MSTLVFKCLLFVSAVAVAACGLVVDHPAIHVYECQVDALAEAVPRGAAEDLVMAARAGNHEYVVLQLLRLGLDEEAIRAAAEAYGACSAPAALPAAEESPPPSYDRS